MIDTIKLAIFVLKLSYTSEDFRSLGWRKRYASSGKFYWFYKERNESKYPFISIYKSPISEYYLWVNVSLPAFYRGSNARLLTTEEVKDALNLLSIYVTEKSGIIFNAQTATVWNVDFAKDFLIGEDSIRPSINHLSKMDISWFNPGGYSDTTCYFHSGNSDKDMKKPRTICFYGKYEDAIAKGFSNDDIESSLGILRTEFRYRDKRALYRLCTKFGLPNHQAETVLTQEVSDLVLASIEDQIRLLQNASGSKSKIYKLIDAYGKRHARGLISFLYIRDKFGTDFYKNEELGYSRSYYRACLKECREVGIWNLLEESHKPLKIDDLP